MKRNGHSGVEASANKQLARLGHLSAGIVHEIRALNNAVLADARMLAEIWSDTQRILRRRLEEEGDFLLGGLSYREEAERIASLPAQIGDCSRKIGVIVDGLKDIALPPEQTLVEEVNVSQTVADTLMLLGGEIKGRTDRFVANLRGDLPVVTGNHQALEQVLINLLVNALEALPSRECGVRISTDHDRDNGRVLIRISDDGVGMPPEVRRRAFSPFFTTKRAKGGLGLGLSISESIVRRHGGTISLDSEDGRGTVATISLPVPGTAV